MPELRSYYTWRDPRWQSALSKAPASLRFLLEDSLRRLLRALQECRDPRLDSQLQEWSPTRWDVPRLQATKGEWVEFRLGDNENRARAIVCFDRKEQVIYLVARTVIHDHGALRELVAKITGRTPSQG